MGVSGSARLMRPRISIPLQLAFGFGTAILVIAVLCAVSLRAIARLREADAAVERTQTVLTDLESLLAKLTDAEAAARSFVLTGAERYLEPYHGTPSDVEALFGRLRGLINDPQAREMLLAMEPVAAERLAAVDKLILANRVEGFEAAQRRVLTGVGRDLMERLRAQTARLVARERALLTERSILEDARARAIASWVAIGGVLSCALIAAAGLLIGVNYRRGQRLAAELDSFHALSLDLLAIADFSGRFVRLNPSWEKTLGWTLEEMMAKPFVDFVHPDDRAKTENEARRLSEGALTAGFENRYRRKDGSYRTLLWSAAASSDRIFAVARDVTERKALESLRDQVTHHVNHELRSPLAAQILSLRMLQAELPGGSEHRAKIDLAERSAVHLGRMVDDLLEVARSETGKLAITLMPFDLGALALEVSAAMQAAAAAKGLVLGAEAPAGLASALGDPVRVRQVFGNLVDNAFKFTPKGGRVSIRVEAEPGGGLRAAVSDTGAGMRAEDLPRVFDRLYQTANVARRGMAGLGLGLYICRELIERQGGRIWVESEKGRGSTFFFTLPPA